MRTYVSALPLHVPIDLDEHIQIHLHEIGHEFGLEHVPGNARHPMDCPENGNVLANELEGRNVERIEAWRMRPDGLSGWNKSQTEGNAQAEDGTLVSMMWPWAMSRNFMSLQDWEYEQIQRSAEIGPAVFWGERRSGDLIDAPSWPLQSFAQTAATRSDAVTVAESLVVTGKISEEGLEISAISRMVDRWPAPPASDYHAELRDANGRVLARAPLGLLAPIDPVGARDPNDLIGWPRFRVVLPLLDGAAELVIEEGERLRARLAAPSLPIGVLDARLVADAQGAFTARWRAQGPVMRTEVAYSRDGEAPWQMLSYDEPDQAFRLELEELQPGPAPTLRITARSGLAFGDGLIALDDVPGLTRARQ